jgi:2-methylcitrate dehydratase PrpD
MELATGHNATVSDVTRRLAERASALRYDDLPPEVVTVAKHCLLDWLGVTLAGASEPLTRLLLDQVREEGGQAQASLIGIGDKVSVPQAALVNGAAGHALDYDDVVEALRGHPTAPVMPAALAMAERRGASGQALLTAFVAGVETECRVGDLMGDSHYAKGWHATGTNGTFGAAAAVARLLELDAQATARAFGIAGTQAAGLKSMFGTMCKPLHAGKAATNGVLAAMLAARGFTSREDVLDCYQGYPDTQSEGADPERAVADLDRRFHLPETLFKYHAACYGTHGPIEAARGLRANRAFDPAKIQRIDVRVDPRCLAICNIQEPKTELEGKFSLRFTVAMALAGEETARLDAFSQRYIGDPKIVALRDKIRVDGSKPMGRATGEVIVHQADGTVLREIADVSTPNADLAAQGRKLTAKFMALATPVIGEKQAAALRDSVASIEHAPDLRGLLDSVAPR